MTQATFWLWFVFAHSGVILGIVAFIAGVHTSHPECFILGATCYLLRSWDEFASRQALSIYGYGVKGEEKDS